MTEDRENDRDNRKIVEVGCPGKPNIITTHFLEKGLRVRLVIVVEHEVIKLCCGD